MHVRVRPIRLLTVEREEPLPLSKLIQSTPCHDNRSAHDNKDDCNDDNGINIGGDNSRKDGMHTTFPISQNNEEGGEVLAAAEVTMHTTRTSVGAGHEVAALAQHHTQSSNTLWVQQRRECLCWVEAKSNIAERSTTETRWL